MESFLPEYLIMTDCEMVGVCPGRDALLQVAMLKLKLVGKEYKVVGKPLVAYLNHQGQPERDFHKKFLVHVFKRCNRSDLTPAKLKEIIHTWLGDLKGKVMPTGDCISTDIDFLLTNQCIDRSDIAANGNPIPGTFHYESFDLNPIKIIARHKAGEKVKPEVYPVEHDALADCVNQTIELNHWIKLLLG